MLPWDDPASGATFAGFRAEENRLYGSGVAQPYGTWVVALAALRALRYVGQLGRIDLGLLLCRRAHALKGGAKTVGALAERSRCVLGVAPSDLEGGIVVSRCGEATYQLKLSYNQNRQRLDSLAAVSALCQRLLALGTLTSGGPREDASEVRVGVSRLDVRGRADRPPKRAEATVHTLFMELDEGRRIDRELLRVLDGQALPGLRVLVEGGIVVPPRRDSVAVQKLYRQIATVAEEINVGVTPTNLWQSSPLGLVPNETAVVDGLGPLGENRGGAGEQILRHSLVDRAGLLALSVHRAASQSD